LGIDSKRLSAIGYGDTRALAYNSKTEGRNRNRRVQLMVFAEDNPDNSKDTGLSPAVSPL
jgi:chemotaxis protein MotB